MFEMYKSSRKKISEEQYRKLKEYCLQSENGVVTDYRLIREMAFSKSKEFVVRMEQMNENEIYIVKKSVWNGITYESSNHITKEECEKLIKGDREWMADSDRPIVNSLYLQMKYNNASPKLICEYMEEICSENGSRKKMIFTYGYLSTRKHLEGFFDMNAELSGRNKGVYTEIHSEITAPSFLLQLT